LAWATLLALLLLSFSIAQSQQTHRPSRRVTHPVRPRPVTQPQPTPVPQGTDPTLVSTAEQANTNQASGRATPKPTPNFDEENARRLQQLTTEVTQLNRKFDALEKERQIDLLQEHLTRAEQRGESLRTELSQTLEKQADLQARADQLDYDLRPESIELRAATIPSMHADEVRTQIRQSLENEKKRVQAQLDLLNSTRTRLETSIATADAEADRLRTRLNTLTDENTTGAVSNTQPVPAPSPTPDAPPPQ
jgi:chromosome segregation ATPase